MKNKILLILFILILFNSCEKKVPGEAPEAIFNRANNFMAKQEYSLAIELYYKLLDEYQDFKKYKADVIYRLGFCLYKTERYDEAEKILLLLINRYKNYSKIKNAYVMLVHIYIQVLKDESKAKKMMDMYKKEFGEDENYTEMSRTLLFLKTGEAPGILKLKEKDIVIIKDSIMDKFDKEIFPVICYESKKRMSNNKKMVVERKKTNDGYYLFLKELNQNKSIKIPGSKNGYAPQWSWDDNYVLFTAMDWDKEERKIKIYDINKNKSNMIFKGKNIESVLCFSPDSTKIIFGYMGKYWIINSNGSNVSLLHKDLKSFDIEFIAWSRDGDKILVKKKKEKKYHILQLDRREITLFK